MNKDVLIGCVLAWRCVLFFGNFLETSAVFFYKSIYTNRGHTGISSWCTFSLVQIWISCYFLSWLSFEKLFIDFIDHLSICYTDVIKSIPDHKATCKSLWTYKKHNTEFLALLFGLDPYYNISPFTSLTEEVETFDKKTERTCLKYRNPMWIACLISLPKSMLIDNLQVRDFLVYRYDQVLCKM